VGAHASHKASTVPSTWDLNSTWQPMKPKAGKFTVEPGCARELVASICTEPGCIARASGGGGGRRSLVGGLFGNKRIACFGLIKVLGLPSGN